MGTRHPIVILLSYTRKAEPFQLVFTSKTHNNSTPHIKLKNKPMPFLTPLKALYEALNVSTLTLNPAALYVKVWPVATLPVAGTAASGVAGVLLVANGPVKTCTLPVVATFLNGKTNVTDSGVATVLTTYEYVVEKRGEGRRER